MSKVRVQAESAIVFVAKARRQAHVRELNALDAIDGAAARIWSSLRGWSPRITRVLRAKRVARVGVEYMMVSFDR